jgi:hypothetical protein
MSARIAQNRISTLFAKDCKFAKFLVDVVRMRKSELRERIMEFAVNNRIDQKTVQRPKTSLDPKEQSKLPKIVKA